MQARLEQDPFAEKVLLRRRFVKEHVQHSNIPLHSYMDRVVDLYCSWGPVCSVIEAHAYTCATFSLGFKYCRAENNTDLLVPLQFSCFWKIGIKFVIGFRIAIKKNVEIGTIIQNNLKFIRKQRQSNLTFWSLMLVKLQV